MQGNFIMLQKDDLKQVVSELVEELVGKATGRFDTRRE